MQLENERLIINSGWHGRDEDATQYETLQTCLQYDAVIPAASCGYFAVVNSIRQMGFSRKLMQESIDNWKRRHTHWHWRHPQECRHYILNLARKVLPCHMLESVSGKLDEPIVQCAY